MFASVFCTRKAISVSEFRKPKIFRRERKIDANYFGFRISEPKIFRRERENDANYFGFRKFFAGN